MSHATRINEVVTYLTARALPGNEFPSRDQVGCYRSLHDGSGVAWERPGWPPSACGAVVLALPGNSQAVGEAALAADLIRA